MRIKVVTAGTLSLALFLLPATGIAFAKENSKPTPSSQSKAPAKKPTPSQSPQSNPSSAKNPNSSNPGTSSNSSPVEKIKAKPSTNSKLDPTKTLPAEANAKADKAKEISSRATSPCLPSQVAKNQDPCSDFLVVFAPGLSRTISGQLLRASAAQTKKTFSSIFNGALVNGPLSKMQALANNPNVLVVEDDLEVTSSVIQTPAPWGLDRIDQKLLPLTNSFNDQDQTGANTYSYIVDTGIDATNIDFEARVTPGYTAVLDGRGSADCNGHGTHVAGTVGGKNYGVAKRTILIPVRVLDCSGSGSYSTVISGLDWIAANHRAGDAAVVNMSLGGSASSTLDGAVRNLIAKGIHVVVAAGNSNADACNYSPARVLDAITVGATTSSDSRASYSNTGSCLDLFAPGSAITSTWLGASATQTISGTSMASPHVAGVIARFISINPTLSPVQVAQSLKSSATSNLVQSAGSSSPNLLLFSEITIDTSTPVTDTSPVFRKVNPRGKMVGKG